MADLARLTAALADRYRVEREIGQGGMATVYLAEDTKHKRKVALKVLRPELAASLGAERFLREIEIAAGLHHPHIVALYDSGSAGDMLYYVMPLVEGTSLRDRITTSGALPLAEGVRIIREVADALAYSHLHGVVHRDIKPENVLLSSGHALVTDFGVAKALAVASGSGPGSQGESAASALTSTGVTLGTPTYMAPEQITADPTLDSRVDIYALGVMSYEMLTGHPPFAGNPQQVIAAHLSRQPEAPSLSRSAITPALESIVMRCLEKNAADRWQRAEDVIRALDAMPASGSVASAALPGVPAATARAPARGRKRWLAGAAIVFVAAIVAAGSWFARDGRAGTLIGEKVLAQNDLVLVSEFDNHTPDSSLAGTVTDAIRMDLQDSRTVRVMTQAAMWAGLARMGLGHGSFLPQPRVQELAEREGAKAIVVGNVARVGSSYVITAHVVATNGGSEPLVASATASDSTALIGAIQTVGRKLRRNIGESLRSVLTSPPLAEVTTASLPALRAYSVSRRAEVDGQRRKAIALAQEALSLDSTFAAAWSGLYVTYSNMGFVRLATEAAQRAYALRAHLSDIERVQIEAYYHETRGENVEAEAAWARLAELGRGLTSYSNLLLAEGRLAEAEVMGRRAVATEPKRSIAYWNLAEAQVGLHHFAAADSTSVMIAAALPENRYRYFIPMAVRWGRRNLDTVESYIRSPDGRRTADVVVNECLVDLHRGKILAWRQCFASTTGTAAHDVLQNPLLTMAEFRMTGDSARARAGYETFLSAKRDERDPDRYAGTIALMADVGRVREARQLLDEWRARMGPTDLGFRGDSALAVGAIAAAEKQWDRAVAAFLAWNTSTSASAMHIYNRGLPEAAAIHARRALPDSAIALFERALSTSSLYGGNFYEASWYTQALSMLGDLHAAAGNRAKAAEYYGRYIETLKGADASLVPQVAAVREKLARVSGEPGGTVKR